MVKFVAWRCISLSLSIIPIFCFLPCNKAEAAAVPALNTEQLTQMPLEALMQIDIGSASKYNQKLSDTPASVTVITSKDIERYGWLTLADVLRSVRSFHLSTDRVYSYLGTRGFSPDVDLNFRVLVMIDGHRINDAIYDQGKLSGDLPIDLGLVDKIEIIRGPGSSMYGGNALFGTINLITKKAKQINGAELAMGGGSWDSWRGRATYGKELSNGLQTVISYTGYGSAGPKLNFPDTPDRQLGFTQNTDFEDRKQFFFKTTYQGLKVEAVAARRKKGDPTGQYYSLFNTSDNYDIDEQAYIDLQYDGRFNDSLSYTVRAYNDWYWYRGNYAYDYRPIVATPFPYFERYDGRAWWWGGEARLNYTGIKNHHLSMGIDYQQNELQRLNYDNQQALIPPAPTTHFLDRTYRIGLFFDDAYTISKQLTLQLGFRFDKTSLNNGVFNPRTALIYRPFETTALKLLYGTAYRDPNSFERLLATVNNINRPHFERIETWEAVWEQNITPDLFFTTSVFHYVLDKQIDTTIGNRDPERALGFESEIDYSWGADARLRLSYSRQMVEDARGGQLLNSPVQLVKANITSPLWNTPFWASAEFQYTGARLSQISVPILRQTTIPGAGIVNMTLGYKGERPLPTLSFSVYNLLDKTYFDPFIIDADRDRLQRNGRSYWLQLTMDFL